MTTEILSPSATAVTVGPLATKVVIGTGAGSVVSLGPTTNVWNSQFTVAQIGAGAITSYTNKTLTISNNTYFNSSNQNIYASTGWATQYQQKEGAHRWWNSGPASGTGGSAVNTLTNGMTLDVNNNLLVGTVTSPTGSNGLVVGGNLNIIGGSLSAGTGTFNNAITGVTTVNAYLSAVTIRVGATSGTLTINNASLELPNASTITVDGANPTISTISTGTASVFNTNVTTGNLFGNATTVNIGKNNGIVLIPGNLSVAGILKLDQRQEKVQVITGATGIVTHNCATGQTFIHNNISSNFTVNLVNLNLSMNNATTINLILNQGSPAWAVAGLQINGSSQAVSWESGTPPPGSSNKQDLVVFTIINTDNGYLVLSQSTRFG
jgi:hypothetical protein